MTVGEALAEARNQAGLSVEELSERTKIRGTIIRSIEGNDYEACGGDLYVRGYVRAIAGAVGIDAQPLVREYDLGRSGGQGVAPPNATRYDMPMVAADPAPTAYDLPRAPEVRPIAGPPTVELPAAERPTAAFPGLVPPGPLPAAVPPGAMAPPGPVPPSAAATRYDLAALPEEPSIAPSEDLMAAGYDLGPTTPAPTGSNAGTQVLPAVGFGQVPPPAPTAWPAPAQASEPRKNRRSLLVVAAAVVVVALGALGFSLVSRGGGTTTAAASSVPSTSRPAAENASASAVAQPKASATAKASAPASARGHAAARTGHVTRLPVASVMAFGPDGFADGDNPGTVGAAIATDPSSPWATQWYTTARFGMLKHGTGLLLDLGRKVTVTTVRLDLSAYQGTDLQLRVGNAAVLGDLHVAATANYVGGSVKLTLHRPEAARYLLIWFTALPPDGSGHYQETVSNVVVTGRRL